MLDSDPQSGCPIISPSAPALRRIPQSFAAHLLLSRQTGVRRNENFSTADATNCLQLWLSTSSTESAVGTRDRQDEVSEHLEFPNHSVSFSLYLCLCLSLFPLHVLISPPGVSFHCIYLLENSYLAFKTLLRYSLVYEISPWHSPCLMNYSFLLLGYPES